MRQVTPAICRGALVESQRGRFSFGAVNESPRFAATYRLRQTRHLQRFFECDCDGQGRGEKEEREREKRLRGHHLACATLSTTHAGSARSASPLSRNLGDVGTVIAFSLSPSFDTCANGSFVYLLSRRGSPCVRRCRFAAVAAVAAAASADGVANRRLRLGRPAVRGSSIARGEFARDTSVLRVHFSRKNTNWMFVKGAQ